MTVLAESPAVVVERDGTVFVEEDACCLRAMADAFSILTGVDVSECEFARLGHRCGRDRAREVARRHEVELDLDEWTRCVERLYFARFDPESLDSCYPPEGLDDALARLQRRGVPVGMVTGMPAAVAGLWLGPLGLERFA